MPAYSIAQVFKLAIQSLTIKHSPKGVEALLSEEYNRVLQFSKDSDIAIYIETLGKKATIHQLTTMLSTSKTSYFQVTITC